MEPSATESLQQVPPQIQASVRNYVDAVNRSDGPGLAAIFTENGQMLAPNLPAAKGRRGIESAIKQIAANKVKIQLTPGPAVRSGDLVYETGTYTATLQPPGAHEPINDRGKDVQIWQRQKDGSWKLAVDIWNSDLPPAGSEAESESGSEAESESEPESEPDTEMESD